MWKEEQQQAFEMRNIKWIFTALEEGSGRENEISPLTLGLVYSLAICYTMYTLLFSQVLS